MKNLQDTKMLFMTTIKRQ